MIIMWPLLLYWYQMYGFIGVNHVSAISMIVICAVGIKNKYGIGCVSRKSSINIGINWLVIGINVMWTRLGEWLWL